MHHNRRSSMWQYEGGMVLLAALVAAGCSAPTRSAPSAAVNLQVAPAQSSGAPEGATSPPTIRVEGRQLVVLGRLDTPNPCQVITAQAAVDGGLVTVRLMAQGVGGVCVTVLGEYAYRVTRALEPGVYQVRVVHEYPGTGWPTVVAREASISVP